MINNSKCLSSRVHDALVKLQMDKYQISETTIIVFNTKLLNDRFEIGPTFLTLPGAYYHLSTELITNGRLIQSTPRKLGRHIFTMKLKYIRYLHLVKGILVSRRK